MDALLLPGDIFDITHLLDEKSGNGVPQSFLPSRLLEAGSDPSVAQQRVSTYVCPGQSVPHLGMYVCIPLFSPAPIILDFHLVERAEQGATWLA